MSDSAEPRAAIIGAGLMGRWHADAVRRIGGRVTVIVDPDARARDELGRRHPGATLLAHLDAKVVAARANAAHICTPLATHVPIGTALIDAGMHLLVEKPFATDAIATQLLLDLAERQGVIACPVHQFLFQDGIERLIEWLPAMGPARRIEFSMCSAGAAGVDAESLDGLVAEILPHPLALVARLLGEPLAGARWQIAHPAPGELNAMTTFGATVVDIAISAHGRPTENLIRVVGDRGSATADLFHGFAVRRDGAVSRWAKIAHPFAVAGATLAGASANLARRTVNREPAYPGLRELVRRFYSSVSKEQATPIAPSEVIDIARARDEILALI